MLRKVLIASSSLYEAPFSVGVRVRVGLASLPSSLEGGGCLSAISLECVSFTHRKGLREGSREAVAFEMGVAAG